jgi:hypothetical protein
MRRFEPMSLLSLGTAALCAAWLSACGSDKSEGSDAFAVGGSGAAVAAGGRGSGGTAGGANAAVGGTSGSDALFSFFVTSVEAMQQLSGNSSGFGGDLRYGMTSGLDGADKICQTIATNEGFGNKTWRAFLSVTAGPVDAIDRIGTGPWYDRLGRLVASGVSGLLGDRPDGLAAVVADLPNEKGVQEYTATGVDDHDTLTGSNRQGRLYSTTLGSTCNDWTSSAGNTGRPMAGHAWPGGPSQNWIQAHTMPGCAPGICLVQAGGGCNTPCPSGGVGCEGGYGGIYCFAL